MKKLLFIFLVLISFKASSQTFGNVGSFTWQRQTGSGYTNYRGNMGALGFAYFYTKAQVDSVGRSFVTGVSSAFGRSGIITAQSGDYSAFYPLLTGSYANPSWLTSLAYSKLTGIPTLLSQFTNDGVFITGAYTGFDSRYVSLSGSYSNPSWLTSLAWSKITGIPTTVAGYGITDFNSLGDVRWAQFNSPAFTGIPTAPTAALGTNTNQIATMAAIQAAIASTGMGTVSSVSVTTANGVSGTVANPTTTPAITLSLGAITPTSTNGVSAATMAYMDATSSIQTQLNSKQPTGNYLTALTGDGTASGPGSAPFTLANVNANTGSFGTASNVPTITYNGKGLATSVANTPILIAESQVTNLVSDLATITNNLTVNIKYPMSYIANATTANVRDSEGDILVVPATGKYLTAYSKFNRGLGDAGAAVIVGKFSTDTTGNDWGSEFLISANIGLQNVLSVSLFASSSTTYACYFNVKNSTSDNRLYRSISTSSGAAGTWSAATQIVNDGAYDDILNAVVRTVNSGRIIIPVATTPISGPTNVWSCYAKYSDDGGTTWSNSNTISPATTLGGVEPVIVQLSGNNLLMTMRTQSNWNWFSNSTDNGATWGTPYQSTLPSLYSPTQMINIGGKLLAGVNANISGNVRNPISLYKSLNNGATWTLVTNIEFGNNSHYEHSYPSFTVSNGYLLVSYYEYVDNIMCNQKFTKIKISDLAL
jgi:predicted neuraminidase